MFLKLTPLLVGTPTPLGSRFWIFSFLHSFFFFPPCLFLFTIFLLKPRRVLHLAFPRERAPQKSEHYVFRPHPDKNTRYAWTTSSSFLPISPTNPHLPNPSPFSVSFARSPRLAFNAQRSRYTKVPDEHSRPLVFEISAPSSDLNIWKRERRPFPLPLVKSIPFPFFTFSLPPLLSFVRSGAPRSRSSIRLSFFPLLLESERQFPIGRVGNLHGLTVKSLAPSRSTFPTDFFSSFIPLISAGTPRAVYSTILPVCTRWATRGSKISGVIKMRFNEVQRGSTKYEV